MCLMHSSICSFASVCSSSSSQSFHSTQHRYIEHSLSLISKTASRNGNNYSVRWIEVFVYCFDSSRKTSLSNTLYARLYNTVLTIDIVYAILPFYCLFVDVVVAADTYYLSLALSHSLFYCLVHETFIVIFCSYSVDSSPRYPFPSLINVFFLLLFLSFPSSLFVHCSQYTHNSNNLPTNFPCFRCRMDYCLGAYQHTHNDICRFFAILLSLWLPLALSFTHSLPLSFSHTLSLSPASSPSLFLPLSLYCCLSSVNHIITNRIINSIVVHLSYM